MPAKPPSVVILVDDNFLDNKLHSRVIQRSGLDQEILTFSMAEDALDYIRKTGVPVDLILLDINMPRMDGFEMLDAAIEEFGDDFDPSVVVMLTTSMDPRDRARSERYGVIKDYFLKPLTVDCYNELMEKLAAA